MITRNQGEKLGNRKGDKETKQGKKEQKQERKQKQRKPENEEGGNRKVNRKRANSSSSGRLPTNWSEAASETKWTLFPPLCSCEAGKSLRGCSAPPPPPPLSLHCKSAPHPSLRAALCARFPGLGDSTNRPVEFP